MFSLCSSNVQDVCISILMLSSQSSCASIEHNLVCVCICVCVHTVCVHRQASLGLRATGSQLTRGPIYHYTHALQVNVTDTRSKTQSQLAAINALQNTPIQQHTYNTSEQVPSTPTCKPVIYTSPCGTQAPQKGVLTLAYASLTLSKRLMRFYSPNTTLWNYRKEIHLSLEVD